MRCSASRAEDRVCNETLVLVDKYRAIIAAPPHTLGYLAGIPNELSAQNCSSNSNATK